MPKKLAEGVSEYDRFPLRLPSKLKACLEESADHNGHSVNSEILNRLISTIPPEHREGIDFEMKVYTFERLVGRPIQG